MQMENQIKSQGLVKSSSGTMSTVSKLNTIQKLELAKGIMKVGTGKNIDLKEGMVKVWDECLSEDIEKGLFTFEQFMEALKVGIRRPVYNRLDYADVYKEAILLSYNSRVRFEMVCPICNDEVIRIPQTQDDVIFAKCDSYELAEHPEIIARRKAIYLIAREFKALFE